MTKVVPALATGNTMVHKPSEVTPFTAHIIAEILHEAGVPKRVYNLVNGVGSTVGVAISGHPGIDMVSFTGSTRASISERQWTRIQGLIRQGIAEGATLAIGGEGRPEGLETGYYVRPTIFTNVRNDMAIAREEIFGPVLCMLSYRDVEDAISIANDTIYGLAAYVQSATDARGRRGRRAVGDWPRLYQRRGRRFRGSVWWLQDVRQWSRVGRDRLRRLPGNQGCHPS
jgi:acyl-CoA reductase-like NAD-dependent aldehyde dehydrogenase